MADKYVVTGTKNRSVNGTEGVILEKDEDGNVTKEISKTTPAELSKVEKDKLDSLGVVVEKVTAEEARKIEEETAQSTVVGSDTAGAAPVFDQGGPGNTSDEASTEKKEVK